MLPFVTSVENVQVTVQTDKVNNVPCGTSGGVNVMFEQIEVVNRLKKHLAQETVKNYTVNYDKTWIFDKIHHEINQFCSKNTLQDVFIDKFDTLDEQLADSLTLSSERWAPGIEIISVRITKPKIPESLMKNYEQVEAQKTLLHIAQQEQKVKEQKADAERVGLRIKAQSEAEIAEIQLKKQMSAKEAQKRIEDIEN